VFISVGTFKALILSSLWIWTKMSQQKPVCFAWLLYLLF